MAQSSTSTGRDGRSQDGEETSPPSMINLAVTGLSERDEENIQGFLNLLNADPVIQVVQEVRLDGLLPVQGDLVHHLKEHFGNQDYLGKSRSDLNVKRSACRSVIKRITRKANQILSDPSNPDRQVRELRPLVVHLGRQLFAEAILTLWIRANDLEGRQDPDLRKAFFTENLDIVAEIQFTFEQQLKTYPQLFSEDCPLKPKANSQELDNLTESTQAISLRSEGPNEDVPQFDGNYRDWDAFWAQFKALVDDNPRLAPIVKFRRLLKALKGEAREQVKGFRFAATNYGPAKQCLEEIYGNPDRILQYMKDKVTNSPPVKEDAPYPEFSRFALLAQEYLRDLLHYTPNAGYSAADILLVIRRKLPKATVSRWMKFSKETNPLELIKQMDTFLSEEMDLWRTVHLDQMGETKTRSVPSKPGKPFHKGKATLHNFATGVSKTAPKRPTAVVKKQTSQETGECFFCGPWADNHPTETCTNTYTPTERKKMILREKRCLLCLKEGHSVNQCKAPPCRQCKGKHHRLLHGAKYIPLKPRHKTSA